MPAYLRRVEIDWSWPQLTLTERAVVRRHEARANADPGTHTYATLKAALAAASRELPGREIRSRARDDGGEYLLVAREGRCFDSDDRSFDEEGAFRETLSAEDYRAAGVEKIYVALYWPEEMLRALQAQAIRLDRSISSLVQNAWIVGASSSDDPAAGGGLPRDGKAHKRSVYLPIGIYAEVAEIAAREDRSMSWVMRRALARAWPKITSLPEVTE
jgi:uncharacterized small protein (TIGR04563 family)